MTDFGDVWRCEEPKEFRATRTAVPGVIVFSLGREMGVSGDLIESRHLVMLRARLEKQALSTCCSHVGHGARKR